MTEMYVPFTPETVRDRLASIRKRLESTATIGDYMDLLLLDNLSASVRPDPETAPLKSLTLAAITAELLEARTKFPGTKHLLAALMEEMGELAKAMLQDKPYDEIEREAIQVACVAIRIVEEGDAAFDVKDWKTDA